MIEAIKSTRAVIGFMEGLMADIQPFFDLMKAEGYIDDAMQLTDKGKEVLHKHWEKELTLTNKRTTIEEHKQIRRDPDGPES